MAGLTPEQNDEYTCDCGDPVSHKDADTCLPCGIDAAYENSMLEVKPCEN